MYKDVSSFHYMGGPLFTLKKAFCCSLELIQHFSSLHITLLVHSKDAFSSFSPVSEYSEKE